MSREFIQSYYLSDPSLCNKLIDIFYQKKHFQGKVGGGKIDKKLKDSTDCPLFITDINNHGNLKKVLQFKNINQRKLIIVGIVKYQVQ